MAQYMKVILKYSYDQISEKLIFKLMDYVKKGGMSLGKGHNHCYIYPGNRTSK